MKYGRMVYFGEMGGEHLVVFDTLKEAQDGKHPDARGRGAHGPVYELTGRHWKELASTTFTWQEVRC